MLRRRFLQTSLLALPLGRAVSAHAQPSVKVVAFAQDTLGNDWRRAQTRGLEEAFAAQPGIRFIHTDAQGNTARQILDIEELAASGIDLLITSPRDAELMSPVIERVMDRGIPVVLLSRRVNGDRYTTFIRADNREIGRQAAAYLARRLNGKGRILVLQHIPTTTPAIERTEGFQQELARHPGMAIAAIHRADSLRDKAIEVVGEAIRENLAFDAIYAQSDSMASGARVALKQAGRDPRKLPIVGIDYIAEAREAIRSGEQAASFVYPVFAREGAEAALAILAGKPVSKEIVVPSTLVTRENVERVPPIF